MKHWMKRLGLGTGLTFAVAFLLVAGVAKYLISARGLAIVRGKVLKGVNETISGHLEFSSLEASLGGILRLHDLTLYDPEGHRVAHVDLFEVDADLGALTTRRIWIQRLRLSGPSLWLEQGPKGLNLARALAPRKEAQPEKEADPKKPFPWTIDLQKLALEDGRVEYRDGAGSGPTDPLVQLGLKAASGSFIFGPRGGKATLELSGEEAAPQQGPLAFSVEIEFGEGLPPRSVKIARLHATLPPALRLEGRGELGSGLATALIRAPLGQGNAELGLKAWINENPMRAEGTLSLQGAELQTLLPGLPAGVLTASAVFKVRGLDAARADGELAVDLAASSLGGQALGPGILRVRLSQGRVFFPRFELTLPGAELRGEGEASTAEVDAKLRASFSDMRKLAQLAALAGAAPPPIHGRGAASVHVSGRLASLGATVEGAFASLVAGPAKLSGLRFEGQVPDLSHPFRFAMNLRAQQGSVAEAPFRDLVARVLASGREFGADLSTAGTGTMKLHVAGEVEAGETGLFFSAMDFEYPTGHWGLAHRAHLDLRQGAVLDALELRNGASRIEARGGVAGEKLDGGLKVERLDLAGLPRIGALAGLGLAGTVDLDASARGTRSAPELQAAWQVRGLKLLRLEGLDLDGEASVLSRRARGKLLARLGMGSAELRFDLPADPSAAPREAPLDLDLEIPALDLEKAGVLVRERLSGEARGALKISGTAASPKMSLSVVARKMAYAQAENGKSSPLLDLDLGGEIEGGAALLTVKAAALSGAVQGRLSLPLDPMELLRAKEPLALLKKATLIGSLDGSGFDLAALAGGWLSPGAEGKLELHGKLEGTLAAPRGSLSLSGTGIALAGYRELSFGFGAQANDRGLSTLLDLTLGGQRAVHLAGSVPMRVEALAELRNQAAIPVSADLEMGPIGVARAGALPGELPLRGDLVASASLRGTLGVPELEGKAELRGLVLRDQPWGSASMSFGYARRKASLSTQLKLVAGGGADLSAALGADLGLGALQSGAGVPDSAPLQARLKAEGLDLAFLSAVAPLLRGSAGNLSAEASVDGSWGAPVPRGRLDLRDGIFSVLGLGTYREVALSALIDDRRVALEKMHAKSSGGTFDAQASAERPSDGADYVIDGSARLVHFPVRNEGRLIGYVGGEATLKGSADSRWKRVDLKELRIPHSRVDLPEIGGKDLQKLEPHPDIAVVAAPSAAGRPKKVKKKAEGGGLDLTAVIYIPRDMWLRSRDLSMELRANPLKLHYAPTGLEVEGNVEAVEGKGRMDVIGRHFEIHRAVVSFNGPPANPRIDAQALYFNEREQVKVRVTVTGEAQKPAIDLSSEPALDQAQIATLLATGRLDLKRGTGAISAAGGASAVTGFLADSVRTKLQAVLPFLSVLNVEFGDESLSSFKVESGTYITDKLYVGARYNHGAALERGENTASGRAEYQLSPHWNVEGEFGDAGKAGLDAIWSHDF